MPNMEGDMLFLVFSDITAFISFFNTTLILQIAHSTAYLGGYVNGNAHPTIFCTFHILLDPHILATEQE